MKSFERILLHLVNVWMFILAGFVIGLTIAYYAESPSIPLFAMAGAIAGLILWWAFRLKLLELILHNPIYQVVVNCVYMVGLFGIFMGVPVFTILPGIFMAYVVGLNARVERASRVGFDRNMRRVNWITLAILCVFLIASAAIALLDPYTGSNLQGMLGLSNEVTFDQIILIILVGGLGLIATQWLLERSLGRWAYALRS